jgi:anhydro-N-acetylmuramic acid kinase
MDLRALRNKPSRYVIGLMSGTSCDGVTAALVRIKGTGPAIAIKLVSCESFDYDAEFRTRLLAPRMDARDVCALNFELGRRFADAAAAMQAKASLEPAEVDFIACSGHTLAHLPPRRSDQIGTLQVGEAAVIVETCRVPVVSDFRTRDMAAGGQGAPLVPYADWVLFRRPERTSLLLNIGGIANLTVVPPEMNDIIAFDTGPGNMAIDGAMRLLTSGKEHMDKDGAMAAQGVVIDEFLDYLLGHPYFNEPPPKSTGREDFGPEVYLRDALASRRDRKAEDIMATVTTAVAYSIVRAYNRYVKPNYEVTRFIIGGGGAHNTTLLKRIKAGLPGLTVRLTDSYGIPADAREAIAFAILGNETICGTPSNVPQATGASHACILGKITPV